MATIFTRIVRGEIPSYKVAEDDRFYAFLDINPMAVGHTLVVPKFEQGMTGGNHIPSAKIAEAEPEHTSAHEVDYIFDLDDEVLGELMVFAKKVAARIKQVTGCARVAVLVLGLEVPYVHVHLVPINSENDVYFRKPRVHLTPEEFAALAEKLAM